VPDWFHFHKVGLVLGALSAVASHTNGEREPTGEHDHSFVTTRGMPKPGSMVSRNTGACRYLGDGAKENLVSRRASTTFSSTIARFCPMQVLGPCPNGMYMCAGLHATATPLANRSGRNSPALGPQASSSRCSIDLATWMIVPRGTSRPPILTSVRASRIISDAGGYSRRVSWITIVICICNGNFRRSQ
jgi:hypothetical protein